MKLTVEKVIEKVLNDSDGFENIFDGIPNSQGRWANKGKGKGMSSCKGTHSSCKGKSKGKGKK